MHTIKTIKHENGNTFRLGRTRPAPHFRLQLEKYLKPGWAALGGVIPLPPPPPTIDYTLRAQAALAEMYHNNTLGDCVIAGMAHAEGVLTGNASAEGPFVFTDKEILSAYTLVGGYEPGHPETDNGCDEVTAMEHWQKVGMWEGGKNWARIFGWMGVKATDTHQVKAAMWLFENLIFGLELPDEWLDPSPSSSGFTWDVAGESNPQNGHCVVGVGYNAHGVLISTWGMIGLMTWEAVAKYAVQSAGGDLYAVISKDGVARASGKGASGMDWAQLLDDFAKLKEGEE